MPNQQVPSIVGRAASRDCDVDYLDRLPPEERAWLERHLRTYYCGERDPDLSPELQAAAYSNRNRTNRDMTTLGASVHSFNFHSEQLALESNDEFFDQIQRFSLTELEQRTLPTGAPRKKKKNRQRMGAEDWRRASASAEDALIGAIDAEAFRRRVVK